MQPRSVTEEDLRRLKQERDAADKRYNEALSELDARGPTRSRFPASRRPLRTKRRSRRSTHVGRS